AAPAQFMALRMLQADSIGPGLRPSAVMERRSRRADFQSAHTTGAAINGVPRKGQGMIICRTPFRISFFGGGTDYPGWYRSHGGAVLATTIDKYCYLSCRYLPPFFEHRFRLVYRKIENCRSVEEITHPAVRETLRFLKIDRGVELHHDGDLPARSGLGSSSASTVGPLHPLPA